MMRVAMLHIGKTAGTALDAVIAAHQDRTGADAVEKMGHRHRMTDLLDADPDLMCGFFVRDPVSRFVSGFNSRYRMGRPRINKPWSPAERIAFETFTTANAMAEALSGADPELRRRAEDAAQAIIHIRLGLEHFLGSAETLEAYRARIVFIGEQESFDSDIERFKSLLGVAKDIMPPADDIAAHRNPSSLPRTLTPRAEENLRQWLAPDYRIYAKCLAMKAEMSV